jgi:hypothetical protein
MKARQTRSLLPRRRPSRTRTDITALIRRFTGCEPPGKMAHPEGVPTPGRALIGLLATSESGVADGHPGDPGADLRLSG